MALRNSILFGILAATAVIAKGPDSHRWRRQATTVTVTAPAETVTVTATNTVTVTAAAGPHPTGGANPTDGATTLPPTPGEEDCDDDPAMTHSANPDSTTIQQHDNGTPAGSATSALPDLAPGNTTIPGQAAANPSAVPDQAPANTTIPGQAASNVSTPISDVTAAGDEAGQIEEPAQVWGVTTSSTPGTNPTGAVDANAGNGTGNPGAAGNPAAPDAAGNTNTPDAAGNTTGAPDAAGNATTPVTPSGNTTTTPVTPSDNATIPGNTSDNATTTPNTPSGNTTTPTGDGKHDVFAHYMLGIVAGHTAADWEKDFAFAQQYGVSAFGLNFGNVDSYTDAQLDLAYAAAEKTGFKVFMSFDFAYYKVDNPDDLKNMADKIKKYGAHAGQYLVDGKPLVSSFMGDTMDWSAVASAAGMEIAAMPNTNNADASATKGIAGFLSWEPWASENNLPVDKGVTLAQDERFFTATGAASLDYIMPISPWFFTHYGKDSYDKNYLFKSEDLWVERWNQALQAGGEGKARFLEILTWNDFGESSYLVDPSATEHGADENNTWEKGFNHAALMDVAKPFITAFKSGQTAPVVETDTAVWWHRPHLKSASCDATDKCKEKPQGADMVEDVVFVAVMTKNGGTMTVTSGDNTTAHDVAPGVQMIKHPMAVGAQTFKLETADGTALEGKSDHDVSADCIDGQYNFNIAVGTFA